MEDNLTSEKLLKIWRTLNPLIYYATTKYCEQGQIYHISKGKYHPEYIVFHPDDLDQVKLKLFNLVSLELYPSEEENEKFIERLRDELRTSI